MNLSKGLIIPHLHFKEAPSAAQPGEVNAGMETDQNRESYWEVVALIQVSSNKIEVESVVA